PNRLDREIPGQHTNPSTNQGELRSSLRASTVGSVTAAFVSARLHRSGIATEKITGGIHGRYQRLASEPINSCLSPTAVTRSGYLAALAGRVDSFWVPDHLNAMLHRLGCAVPHRSLSCDWGCHAQSGQRAARDG